MRGDAWWRPETAPARRIGARAVAVAAAALVLLGAACGSDGRALRPPSPDQTTTTTVPGDQQADTGVDAGSATGEAAALQLTSPAFADGDEIPLDHTCRGRDLSPPLSWTAPPAGTAELAVVVRDVDAEGLVHWVLSAIPPATTSLEEGARPEGAAEAANDLARVGWAGPCPPAGTHHYEFRLYALAEPSGVAAGQAGGEAAALVESTPAVASAVLSGWAEAG